MHENLRIKKAIYCLGFYMDWVIVYKILTVPVVIMIISFLAKKWGSFIGGIFAGLPIFSGPISLFMALEQGPEFVRLASYNSMLGLLGCVVTALVYAWLAYFKLKWWLALPCALLSFFGAEYLFHLMPEFSSFFIVITLCSAFITLICLPKPSVEQYVSRRPHWVPWAQIILGTTMVYGVTELAHIMGPRWSGTLSCFPFMIVLLAPFTHVVNGVYATVMVLRGFATGWLGTALFSFTVILTVMHFHVAAVYFLAFFCACAGTLLYSLCLVYVHKKIAE